MSTKESLSSLDRCVFSHVSSGSQINGHKFVAIKSLNEHVITKNDAPRKLRRDPGEKDWNCRTSGEYFQRIK